MNIGVSVSGYSATGKKYKTREEGRVYPVSSQQLLCLTITVGVCCSDGYCAHGTARKVCPII